MTYYDFPASDTSSIAVAFETYHTLTHIETHMHRFYEFALITRGTCTHSFRGVEAPLIVGDVFIIPPHEAHGYTVQPNTSIANCYFFPERLGQLTEYVHAGTFQKPAVPSSLSELRQQWDSLLETISLHKNSKKRNKPVVTDNLSKQGVLHLDPAAAMDVETLLMRIHEEHINFEYDSEYMKSAILQMILVIFKRTRYHMPQKPPVPPPHKKQLILNSLIFLENNYPAPLSIKEIAEASSLSESYFRTVFKDVTGLSPLDYLNWLRVVKALEYLQTGGMSVADAAAKVGILDANYFSRLFKKLMGQPPNYFKKYAISKKREDSHMVKVDLITGFLGAGKTTFIRRYADYFMRKGLKINIIENEFGGVNVDSIMLKDEDCDISQIAGGCMCCTAKISFQNMLLDASASGYDRILVEPSGIYDVDEFFETMLTEPVKDCCEIGSILTIADAQFDDKLSAEAQYIMFSQLLCTGMAVMSKTQDTDISVQEDTVGQWNRIIREHGGTRIFGSDVCRKNWEDFTDEDFAAFASCGYEILEHQREFMQHGRVFTARVMANLCKDAEDLETRLTNLFSDPGFGTVLRVKGHIADVSGNWYEINCSLDGFYIKPVSMKKGLFLVIGQDLDEKAVMDAFLPRQKK